MSESFHFHGVQDMASFERSRHGWVNPLPSGAKARCGGPPLCKQCAQELTEKRREALLEIIEDWRRAGVTQEDLAWFAGVKL